MKIIPISGHIGFDVWPEQIRAQLPTDGSEVEFHISSGGGFISDGLEIFNLIDDYPGKTTARIIGMAASMASYIPLAADKVIAKSNAVFMIHGALTGVYGNEEDHREAADILAGFTNLLSDIYVKKTGKTKAEIDALLKKDSYFFGKEMLDAGFVDEIDEIEVSDTDDQAALLAVAKASVQLGIEKVLAATPEKARANMTRAAALLPTDPPKPAKAPVKPTHSQGETMNEKEFLAFLETNPEAAAFYASGMEYIKAVAGSGPDVVSMNLSELLALAPQAQTEHETALTEAVTTAAGTDIAAHAAKVKKITNVLKSDAYDAKRKSVAVRALADEITIDAFDTIIAMYDSDLEELASAAASDEQPDDTPPGGADMGEESSINSPKHQANISTLKSQLNLSQPTDNTQQTQA